MKKLLLLPIFFFAALSVSKGQPPITSAAPSTNGAVMTFDETEFDFGTITQGDSVTHVFKFKNTGKEPLIITEAHGSCGCTVPVYPKDPIKPNGTGVITVTFHSAGKMGIQNKTVTITYGDGQQALLYLKGNVLAPNVQPAPSTNKPVGAAPPQTNDQTKSPSSNTTSTTAPAGKKSPAKKPKK